MKGIDYNKWLYESNPHNMPRKIKKAIYGTKISRSKLRKEINKKSLKFCPCCRHKLFTKSTGNMASYPEIWEHEYCSYCELILGGADNSVGNNIISAAQYLISNHDELDIEKKQVNTIYKAVKYIGADMKDYI